jgi:hypothetical protein
MCVIYGLIKIQHSLFFEALLRSLGCLLAAVVCHFEPVGAPRVTRNTDSRNFDFDCMCFLDFHCTSVFCFDTLYRQTCSDAQRGAPTKRGSSHYDHAQAHAENISIL